MTEEEAANLKPGDVLFFDKVKNWHINGADEYADENWDNEAVGHIFIVVRKEEYDYPEAKGQVVVKDIYSGFVSTWGGRALEALHLTKKEP